MNETETMRIRQMNAQHIARITKQLEQISRAFLAIKKSGISRDILIAYLKDRTDFGKQDITRVLEAQDEFYQKLAKLAGE